jgi:lipoprotein-releasing system permease protein
MNSKAPNRQGKRIPNIGMGLLTRRFLTKRNGNLQGRHWLTFTGVMLGVFALLTVSSVMNGFDQDMRQRIIGTRSEIRIENKDASPIINYEELITQLTSHPEIKAAVPVIRNELMLVKESAMAPTVCYGIDLTQHQSVSPVLHNLTTKELSAKNNNWQQGIIYGSVNEHNFADNGIVIGVELAQSLIASVGDTIKLVSPLGTIPTPLGLFPQTTDLVIVGLFVAGMPEYDRLYSYVPLSVGQYFSGYETEIDHIELKTRNPKKLFSVTKKLRNTYPNLKVENWSSFDANLYRAMHFEKYLMLVVLSLMYILASFNMAGNIYKTIIQKRKAIGILKTLGLSNRNLVLIFLRQGLFIAVSGIIAGIVLSLILLVIQDRFALIQLPVGTMPNLVLPVDIRLGDYLIIPAIAFFISFISIYIPARKAMQVNPLSLIRDIV